MIDSVEKGNLIHNDLSINSGTKQARKKIYDSIDLTGQRRWSLMTYLTHSKILPHLCRGSDIKYGRGQTIHCRRVLLEIENVFDLVHLIEWRYGVVPHCEVFSYTVKIGSIERNWHVFDLCIAFRKFFPNLILTVGINIHLNCNRRCGLIAWNKNHSISCIEDSVNWAVDIKTSRCWSN